MAPASISRTLCSVTPAMADAAASAPAPALPGAEQFNWPPLESDPEIFAQFAAKLGLEAGFTASEIFSFDAELLAPALMGFAGPAVAAIVCVRRMPDKKADDKSKGDLGVECNFYMDQTASLDNACGLIALIHAILNNPACALKDGSPLALFRDANQKTTPAERAVSLDGFTAIHDLYKVTAQEGNAETASGVHVHNGVEKTFHFIAYVINGKGQLIELDGTKVGPLVIAEGVAPEDLLAATGKELIRKCAEGEIDPSFASMALGPCY